MKYGTALIVLGLVNVIAIFSGIPTGWKKVVIIITTGCLVLLGWTLRAIAKSKARKIHSKAAAIEAAAREEMAQITEEITQDVSHKVEQEIDQL
jgi:flagellar biosynthesis component FlhA